jgi:hypothetical protein
MVEQSDKTAPHRAARPITGSLHSHLEQHLVILLAGLRLDLLSQANDGLEVGVVGLLLYAKIDITGSDTLEKERRMVRRRRVELDENFAVAVKVGRWIRFDAIGEDGLVSTRTRA